MPEIEPLDLESTAAPETTRLSYDAILDELSDLLKLEATPEHPDVADRKRELMKMLNQHRLALTDEERVLTEAQVHGEEELSQADRASTEHLLEPLERFAEEVDDEKTDSAQAKRRLVDGLCANLLSIGNVAQDIILLKFEVKQQLRLAALERIPEEVNTKINLATDVVKNIFSNLAIPDVDNFDQLLEQTEMLETKSLEALRSALEDSENAFAYLAAAKKILQTALDQKDE